MDTLVDFCVELACRLVGCREESLPNSKGFVAEILIPFLSIEQRKRRVVLNKQHYSLEREVEQEDESILKSTEYWN